VRERCRLSPKRQVRFAWFNLIVSVIALPLTIWLTDEPPFILGLSWYAVTVTALGWISAAEANRQVQNDEGPPG
jgi:drug/metabolite transporter (DMT)-like permease